MSSFMSLLSQFFSTWDIMFLAGQAPEHHSLFPIFQVAGLNAILLEIMQLTKIIDGFEQYDFLMGMCFWGGRKGLVSQQHFCKYFSFILSSPPLSSFLSLFLPILSFRCFVKEVELKILKSQKWATEASLPSSCMHTLHSLLSPFYLSPLLPFLEIHSP